MLGQNFPVWMPAGSTTFPRGPAAAVSWALNTAVVGWTRDFRSQLKNVMLQGGIRVHLDRDLGSEGGNGNVFCCINVYFCVLCHI